MLFNTLSPLIVDEDLPNFLNKMDEIKSNDPDVRAYASSIYFLLNGANAKQNLTNTEKDLLGKFNKFYEKHKEKIANLLKLAEGTELKEDIMRILSINIAEHILKFSRNVPIILTAMDYGKRLAVDYGLPISPLDLVKLANDNIYLPVIYGVETFNEEEDKLSYSYGTVTATNDILKARKKDFVESVVDEDVLLMKLLTYFVGYNHGKFDRITHYYLLDTSASMGVLQNKFTKLAIGKAVILKLMKKQKGKVGLFSGNLVDILDMKKKNDVLKFLSVKPRGGTDLLGSLISFVKKLKKSNVSITVVSDGFFPYYDVKNELSWYKVQLNFVIIGGKSKEAEELARISHGGVVSI